MAGSWRLCQTANLHHHSPEVQRLPRSVEFRTVGAPSNSGVFLEDRYEANINETYGRTDGEPNGGFDNCTENAHPKIRPCFPPLAWQTFDIDFHAPRFDSNGKKTASANATVLFNGVKIYDHQELELPHGAASRMGEAKVPQGMRTRSNAYAMVAWGVNNKQLGTHPIPIGWNRNANEGLLGRVSHSITAAALRHGSTPLRDTEWHHVAVVFIPCATIRPTRSNAKQYVDGRFDGEGKPSTPGSDIFTASGEHAQTANGTVWLGCRLGTKGAPRYERFTGDMDELFIADGALGPPEIVRLMSTNRIDD